MPLAKLSLFAYTLFWRTKRKSTKTIMEWRFSCQNKSVCQILAWSRKKWKSAQKAIYTLFAPKSRCTESARILLRSKFCAQFPFSHHRGGELLIFLNYIFQCRKNDSKSKVNGQLILKKTLNKWNNNVADLLTTLRRHKPQLVFLWVLYPFVE